MARFYTQQDNHLSEDITMRISTVQRIATKIAASKTEEAAFDAAVELRNRLEAAILRSKALTGFFPTQLHLDNDKPFIGNGNVPSITLQYWNVLSSDYATSLTFRLEDGSFYAIVRTLHLKDNQGASSLNIQQVNDGGRRLEDIVTFYSVEGLAKLAVQRGVEQRVGMLQRLGFSVGRMTMKKLIRSALQNVACLAF
jgi:hypothetical protein